MLIRDLSTLYEDVEEQKHDDDDSMCYLQQQLFYQIALAYAVENS